MIENEKNFFPLFKKNHFQMMAVVILSGY